MTAKLTPEDIIAMRAMRAQDHTFAEIGERFGVSDEAVRRRLSKQLPVVGENAATIRLTILAAYSLGRSVTSIARAERLKPAQVAEVLRSDGIDPQRWHQSEGAGRRADAFMAVRAARFRAVTSGSR